MLFVKMKRVLLFVSLWLLVVTGRTVYAEGDSFQDPIGVDPGEWVSGALTSAEGEVYYCTAVPMPGYFRLVFKNDPDARPDAHWVVTMYDRDHNFLLERKFYARDITERNTMLCGVGMAQTYYFKIHTDEDAKASWSKAKYSFMIDFEDNFDWEYELNNSFENANWTRLGRIDYGNLMDPEDEDYYKFNVPEAGRLRVFFKLADKKAQDHKWYLRVYDSSHWPIMDGLLGENVDDSIESWENLPAGDYWLRIDTDSTDPDAWSDSIYSVNINCYEDPDMEKEDNNSFEKANPIQLNHSYDASMKTHADEDYYTFSTDRPGSVSLALSWLKDENVPYWIFEIYDANRNQLLERKVRAQKDTPVETGKIGLDAGKYYLRIRTDYDWYSDYYDMPYTMALNFKKTARWETERNDSFKTADDIQTELPYSGSVMESLDADYYRFRVGKTGGYRLSFDHEKMNSVKTFWKADLYDSSEKKLASYSYTGNGKKKGELPIALKKGTYYLRVKGGKYQWSDVTYKFAIQSAKLPQPMTIKTKPITISAEELKKAKKIIPPEEIFTIKKAKGNVRFKQITGSEELKLTKKGKLTIKKNTKPGKYKIRVRAAAAGDKDYCSGALLVSVKVKVTK